MDTESHASGAPAAQLPRRRMTGRESRALVSRLRQSKLFKDYESAFRETTGLPIALQPTEALDLPHRDDPAAHPFCKCLSTTGAGCCDCIDLQQRLMAQAAHGPATLPCSAGFHDSAIPIHVGDTLVAYLHTGQARLRPPTERGFGRAIGRLASGTDFRPLRSSFFKGRVLSPRLYESVVRLLAIFGQQLSALSNQLMVEAEPDEPPSIVKARELIGQRYAEALTLRTVAEAVNMSAFYFCKTFKRSTGLTFTEYLARVRIEVVKNRLVSPHMRVSEAAYEAGFQSLSQFNRVFRRIAGESPSTYRGRLHSSARFA